MRMVMPFVLVALGVGGLAASLINELLTPVVLALGGM